MRAGLKDWGVMRRLPMAWISRVDEYKREEREGRQEMEYAKRESS